MDYNDAILVAQSRHYDLLLAVDGEAVNVDILWRLKPLVGASVLWAWEDPYERARTVALAPLFDRVFTNDLGSVSHYPEGAELLSLAATERLPVKEHDEDFEYDICFVGSAWPNRVIFLRKLMREFPELKMRIVLSYNAYLPRGYLDLPDADYVGSVAHEDFLRIANASRVNLTLHRDFSGDGLATKAESPGPRLFETALAGGYQLVDGAGTTLEQVYEAGEEIETFVGFADGCAKLRAALADPARRLRVARAAQERTARDHIYARRIDRILGSLPDRSERRQPVAASTSRKPRVLFVTHNTISGGNFGGVEVYQETVANQLRSKFDILYYRPSQPAVSGHWREYVLTNDRHHVLQRYSVPDFDVFTTLMQPQAEEVFADVLSEQAIDLVHFHHLLNHVPSLPLVAKLVGVPTLTTLQDFWGVCSRFNLLDHRRRYCAIVDRPQAVCDICLERAEGRTPGSQGYRRSFFSAVMCSYDRLMGNSPSAAAIFRGVYPEIAAEKVVPIGLPAPWSAPRALVARGREATGDKRPLRVVFLGNFTDVKGAADFLEAAALLRDDDILFTICGRLDEPYPQVLRELALTNVQVEGGFEPGDLDLLRFDVSLHLSVWPETYCITLSEAWKAGVVPIVTACGALDDRVTHGENGFKVPINGSGELVSLLRWLAHDRRAVDEVRERIRPELWLTPEQHCETLSRVYSELIAAAPQPRREPPPHVQTGAPTGLAISGRAPPSTDWTRPEAFSREPLPDPMQPLLNPLWREIRQVQAAFRDRRLHVSASFRAEDASFSSAGGPSVGGWASWAGGHVPVLTGCLTGWRTLPHGVMMALRSAAGDIVLRPAVLHDMHQARAGRTAGPEIGVLVDGITPQMLDDGLYGVEFMLWRDGQLEIASAAAAVIVRAGRVHFLSNDATIARILLPARGTELVADALDVRLLGNADEVKVTNAAANGMRPELKLSLRGWLLDGTLRAAPFTARLLGPIEGHVPLEAVGRPDVVQHFGLPQSAADCGYAGAIWLSDLPAGTYEVQIVKHRPQGLGVETVATLELGPRPEDAELSVPPSARVATSGRSLELH